MAQTRKKRRERLLTSIGIKKDNYIQRNRVLPQD